MSSSPGRRDSSPRRGLLSADRFKRSSWRAPEAHIDPQPQPAIQLKPVTAALPTRKQAAAEPGPLELISADLESTLDAWKTQAERGYGDTAPAAQVTVTIIAATGVSKSVEEPFWVAAISGAEAETGASEPFEVGNAQIPKGAPSWQNAPLKLAVHDITADLMLLLCEAGGTSARRACVGRAVLPLSELLPLMPFGVQPAAFESWIDILPPASEYALGTVQPTFGAAIDTVDASGMPRPPQKGRAFIRVGLTLRRALMSAYMSTLPFDAAAGVRADARASRSIMPPERVQIACHRANAMLEGCTLPACVRMAGRRPLTSGGALLVLIGWLCFGVTAPMLPWWLLAAWAVNGDRKEPTTQYSSHRTPSCARSESFSR